MVRKLWDPGDVFPGAGGSPRSKRGGDEDLPGGWERRSGSGLLVPAEKKASTLCSALSAQRGLSIQAFVENPDCTPEGRQKMDECLVGWTTILADVANHVDGKEIKALTQDLGFRPVTMTPPIEVSQANLMEWLDTFANDGMKVMLPGVTVVAEPAHDEDRRPMFFVGADNLALGGEVSGQIVDIFNPSYWGWTLGGLEDGDSLRFFVFVGLTRKELQIALRVSDSNPHFQEYLRSFALKSRMLARVQEKSARAARAA